MSKRLTEIILLVILLVGCREEKELLTPPDPVLLHQVPVIKNNVVYLSFDAGSTTTEHGYITGMRIAKNGIGLGDPIVQYWTVAVPMREVAQLVNIKTIVRLNVWNVVSTALGSPGYAYADASYTFFVDRNNINEFGVIVTDSEGGSFEYLLH